MPRYIIERDIAGVGTFPQAQIVAMSQKSRAIVAELGPNIQWVESYVTDDRIYCTYIAPNEALIREHARRGGFPANRIARVRSVMNPTTAED